MDRSISVGPGRALRAVSLGVAMLLAACGGRRAKQPATADDPASFLPSGSGAPAWLPPYSSAQLALLSPVDAPVHTAAARVFPDLQRFGYARDVRIGDPAETMKFTRMVASVLQDSPRFYALSEASPALANTIAQYGPPGELEADAWSVVKRGTDGVGWLVRAEIPREARALFDRGSKAYAAGDLTEAIEAFRGAAAKGPAVPGLHEALAEALAAAGDDNAARVAFEETLAVDPTFATAHRGLADLLVKAGQLEPARREIAEALAYHPISRRALEVADLIVPGAAGDADDRLGPFPIFLDVDSAGAIRMAAGPSSAAQMYGGCRAVMRYEPDVRVAIFEQPRETPYSLTMVEEVVCVETAIGAYLLERAGAGPEGGYGPPDPQMEALLELGQREGLAGYVMFEILGQARPERARAAPPAVHAATVRYVEEHVLGGQAAPPQGRFADLR